MALIWCNVFACWLKNSWWHHSIQTVDGWPSPIDFQQICQTFLIKLALAFYKHTSQDVIIPSFCHVVLFNLSWVCVLCRAIELTHFNSLITEKIVKIVLLKIITWQWLCNMMQSSLQFLRWVIVPMAYYHLNAEHLAVIGSKLLTVAANINQCAATNWEIIYIYIK